MRFRHRSGWEHVESGELIDLVPAHLGDYVIEVRHRLSGGIAESAQPCHTNPASPSGRLITAAPLANAATVVLDGRSVTPDYAGLTDVGLNQINFRVPADLAPGSYSVQVIVETASTQAGGDSITT
jgi:hypothetical protein